jgi:aldehyde dehydrogenase (NAD+)
MTLDIETAGRTGVLYRHFIGGDWREPVGEETVAVINPATEGVVAEVPRATVEEAERAVRAARAAFDEGPWPRMSGAERAKILRTFAEGLWAEREHIAEVVVAQGGCTISQAEAVQVYAPIQALYGYADLALSDAVEASSFSGGLFPSLRPGAGASLVVREPVGVVAAITPFNYPFFLNLHKVGPALASGCTVVLKPTEYICLDAVEIARIAAASGLPAGVLNVLLGAKADVGEVLTTHPLVDHVSFTGSTQTGRRIMANAAQTIKSVTLELGGKSANIIFADAHLDSAMAGDSALVIRHCGQGCGHLSRVLVQDAVYDEVLERMKARAATVVVGDPADRKTEMGPLVSEAQRDRVAGYIASGIDEGAQLVAGGGRPEHLPKGYFMEPTIFAEVRNDMKIAQEEIFGPVVCVARFADEEDAVAVANDSIYGLNGGVWSGDLARGLRVAGRIRTGTISVNGGGGNMVTPYGGYKQSGVGREFGHWAYKEYTQLKSLSFKAS